VNALLVTVPGFVGPVRLPAAVELIIDIEAAQPGDYAAGANEDDTHLLHVLPGRDFSLDKVCDLRLVEAGEPCPHCGAPLHTARGIEVGQVFNLGTKYSEALGAGFVDENGAEQPFHMGCYGIGVGRTMAAAIEQLGDENGLVWPLAIAPYQVVVIPANMKDETVAQTALELYEKLLAAGVEAVFDDRDERPGVKFKDADLVGYPLRLVISAKTLAEGKAELKGRTDKTPEFIPLPATVDTILKLLVITSHCEESGS
jgi:prolyl-tRNA synthetase